jgi:prefoldin subunit 5
MSIIVLLICGIVNLKMEPRFVDDILSNRSQFLKHLRDDLAKNEQTTEEAIAQLEKLRSTVVNVKTLGEKVEHPSLIPLGKNIYVNATIKHTGEYFMDKLAFPESYSVLETLDKTVTLLEDKIKKQSQQLEKNEAAKVQVEERIKLFEGDEIDDNTGPEKIFSDKGVAVKVGDFYEIVEFENT